MRRRLRRFASARGQATVELVALVPLVLAAALAAATVLAAQSATEHAGAAAQAGAMALIQDGDPRAAARAALPPRLRDRAGVAVRGRRVTVILRPRAPIPGLAATESAHAGPEVAPVPAALEPGP